MPADIKQILVHLDPTQSVARRLAAAREVAQRLQAELTGLYAVTWYLGGFGGPALIGAVVDLTGWHGMLLDIAVLASLAVLAIARLGHLQRQAAANPMSNPADTEERPGDRTA